MTAAHFDSYDHMTNRGAITFPVHGIWQNTPPREIRHLRAGSLYADGTFMFEDKPCEKSLGLEPSLRAGSLYVCGITKTVFHRVMAAIVP